MTEVCNRVGDMLLKQEMYFVESIRTVVVPSGNIIKFLAEHSDPDARQVRKETLALVKDARSAWATFSAQAERMSRGPDCRLSFAALGQLFKHTEGRMAEPLVGLIDTNQIVACVESLVKQVCMQFGDIWSEQIKCASDQLNSWCPAWTHARDHLLDKKHTPIILALCKNEHYGKLAGASNLLRDMITSIRGLHGDDTKIILVDSTVLTAAKQAATLGTETTVITQNKQHKRITTNNRS